MLLKVCGNYPEMAAQEKIVDSFVELIKRDQLDENVPTEPLEKCVAYYNTLFPVIFGSDIKINQAQLLSDYIKSLSAAVDGFNLDAAVIRCLIEVGRLSYQKCYLCFFIHFSVQTANVGDISLLSQHVISTSEQLHQQLKSVKRRLPSDMNISNLGLSKEVLENLYQCYQQSGKIIKTLHDIVKTTIQSLSTDGGK